MLEVLIESTPRAKRRGARFTIVSAVAHAGLITAAVMATTRNPSIRLADPVRPESLVYVRPSAPAPMMPTDARSLLPNRHGAELRAIPLPAVPAIDVSVGRPLSITPDDYIRGDRGILSPGRVADVPSGGVYIERLVDRPVIPRPDNPRPDYPPQLRRAAVEGEVQARFIVDTAGRVEGSSLAIMRTTHPLFAESVRRWLSRTRYMPAEAGGHRVRQLVEQRIGFTLQP